MQPEKPRRSNRERTDATRAALLAAARALFVDRGYAETGTPEIVERAGVTRGALYHHFADKKSLLAAAVEAESRTVADEIEAVAPEAMEPVAALVAGGAAFLSAMAVRGRTRLLLLDGPAVLGRAEMDRIDLEIGAMRSLRAGLAVAMREGAIRRLPLEAATALVSAAYDRAALAVEAGAPANDQLAVLAALVEGLAASPRRREER